jgi:hypothetical protein
MLPVRSLQKTSASAWSQPLGPAQLQVMAQDICGTVEKS